MIRQDGRCCKPAFCVVPESLDLEGLMADNFISNDINTILNILPHNYANKSWILSKLNETFTLTIKWNLAPATTPSTGRIGHGILTPPQSATARSTPCSFQANARHTPAQLVTRKKYKSPSTRRRDRSRLLAWKKSRQNTPGARRSLFRQDSGASDIPDIGPVSDSLESDCAPSPVATVTLDLGESVETQLVLPSRRRYWKRGRSGFRRLRPRIRNSQSCQ